MSQSVGPDGRTGVFPHTMDRAKLGSIGVRADGKRFVHEANGYYDYVSALLAATPDGEAGESKVCMSQAMTTPT